MEGKLEAPDCIQHTAHGLGAVGDAVVRVALPVVLDVEVHAGTEDNGLQLAVVVVDNGAAAVHTLAEPNLVEDMAGQAEADLVVLAGLDMDDVLAEVDNALLASWTLVDFEEKIG